MGPTTPPVLLAPMNGVSTSGLELNGDFSPKNLSAPQVTSGSDPIIIGSEVSSSTGTWSANEPINFSYQWVKNGESIVGQVGENFTIPSVGTFWCAVTGIDANGIENTVSSNKIIVTE